MENGKIKTIEELADILSLLMDNSDIQVLLYFINNHEIAQVYHEDSDVVIIMKNISVKLNILSVEHCASISVILNNYLFGNNGK